MHEVLTHRLRTLESLYRAEGFFEAAVTMQRHADHIEAGEELPLVCSFSDRGAAERVRYWKEGNLLGVQSSDGSIAISFTPDRALTLWWILLDYLEFTPMELSLVALNLVKAGVPVTGE